MPTFHDPIADAEEAHQALRGLCHALYGMDDPTMGYQILGSLGRAATSFQQALNHIARFYDTTAVVLASVDHDRAEGRDTALDVGSCLREAATAIGTAVEPLHTAHNTDARITYDAPADAAPRVARSEIDRANHKVSRNDPPHTLGL